MNNVETKVIGLNSEFPQSGKDTIGAYLVAEKGFTRVSFADALRKCLYAINPLIPSNYNNHHTIRLREIVDAHDWEWAKTNYPEVRRLLQQLGTEAGREVISPDVWVRIAQRKAIEVLTNGGKVVFTDMRFENEAEMVRFELGGTTVRVQRDDAEESNGHKSDRRLPDGLIDIEIENNGTFSDLYREVELKIFA